MQEVFDTLMTYGMTKGQGGFSGHPKLEGGDGGYLGHPVTIQQFPAKSVTIPQDDIPKGIIKPVKKKIPPRCRFKVTFQNLSSKL